MNVMQLNTDIYNSLGVLSNDESYLEKAARYLKKMAQAKRDVENAKAKGEALASIVLEHNNAESCWYHSQQDSVLSLLFLICRLQIELNRTLQNSLVIFYSAFICCSVSVASCC